MHEVLVPLVLLLNGLSAGVLTGTLLGGVPLLLALPDDRYVHAHAFFATRYDPFMPACFIGTVLGDVVLVVVAPTAATAVLFAVAAVLAAGAVVISLLKNVPINKWVCGLDPDHLPADFAERDPRRAWQTWNRARSALAIAALLVNAAAVALLL
ncbi:DUF1772 domain-containing protein [Saccharopolyspora indica]|uniref:anthrone oxygenase family protein n=1 Tax=Saccharopolyspora indica TaxID=1229659 RepID=UPI0022EB637C|nr:anthrone oxygenase family protein [Saccharopolyspora indica]MDA3647670.1 DUF1772 domain-containing protein [Saccharopolyspora indica]